jgi:hypothetical protein
MRALRRYDGMLMTKTLYRRTLSLRSRSPETTASRFLEALGEAASARHVRAQLRLARQARSRKEFDFWAQVLERLPAARAAHEAPTIETAVRMRR